MSVLVRGMDMPQCCGACKIDTSYCRLWEHFRSRTKQRHPDCPLEEVKVPHGRLIDAKQAEEAMLFEMCGTGFQSRAMGIVKSDFLTRTVVEAEVQHEADAG